MEPIRPRAPTFSGSSGESVSSFWTAVELYFLAIGVAFISTVPDTDAIPDGKKQAAMVATMLDGVAKNWLFGLDSDVRSACLASPSALREALSKQFRPLDTAMDARLAISKLRVSDFTTFDEFSVRFVSISRRDGADFSFGELLQYLLGSVYPCCGGPDSGSS